jgi:low affinity Fe/Cu permease
MDPDLIGKVGLPIALTVVLVAFFLRTMFPYMVKQVEHAQAQTNAAIAAFIGLKDTLVQQTEINRQTVTLLQRLLEKKQ